MTILDWFDIDNIVHIQAYEHLRKTGLWPKDFVPANIEFIVCWQMSLDARLAGRYVEKMLKKEDERSKNAIYNTRGTG